MVDFGGGVIFMKIIFQKQQQGSIYSGVVSLESGISKEFKSVHTNYYTCHLDLKPTSFSLARLDSSLMMVPSRERLVPGNG